MKKTTLFVCMQLAFIASTNVNAKSRQKSYNSNYNQLYINDQSLRQQQNDIAKELNNLQSYTKEQNKIYDEAINGLIKENDQLISLNQNMLAEIERLNNEIITLKETTETNKSNIAALTKAVTKKVKKIQEYIDKQEQEFNNLSNKGKLLLIGLCILSLLLSALLWSLIRKQNKKTMKLKAEVERVLNQIQANTDSSMATWAEQQTDTLNIWKKDFHTQMTEVIQQTIKDTTHFQIQELQKVADANIAAERLKLENMLAEKQSEEQSLNLSQLSRNDDADEVSNQEVAENINQSQAFNPAPNKADNTVNTGHFSSSSLLNELDSVMTEETNTELNNVNDVTNDMNQAVIAQDKPNPTVVDLDSQVKAELKDSADDIFAVLDSQTAEFAAKADVTLLGMDRVILDDVEDELDEEEVSLAQLEVTPVVTDNVSASVDEDLIDTIDATEVSSPSLEMMKQIDAFNTHGSDEEPVPLPSIEVVDTVEESLEYVLPAEESHTEKHPIVADKANVTIETAFSKTESNVAELNKTDINKVDLNEVDSDSNMMSATFAKPRYTNVEKDVVIEKVNPLEQYNLAMSSENSGNIDIAIHQYEQFVNDFEFKTDAETTKLVGLALDKKAKLLLSGNKVNEAINAYDALISHYENSTESSQLQILSEAILNSSLLELIHTGSINGSKVGTARAVFKNSPQNMLAMEAFETLRLSTRRDVSNTQKDLLQKYEDVDLIPLDWTTMETWANGLNERTKARTLETIQFFKNWNGQQPSVFS